MSSITYKNGVITTETHQQPLQSSKGAGHVFFTYLQKHSENILQIDGITGKTDTYGSVLERSIRIAVQMRNRGVTSGDIVTICTINHLNSCVPFFGALFLGAKLANLDHRIPIVEAKHLMQQIDPKIIFVGLEGVDFIETVLKGTNKKPLIIAFGETTNHQNYFNLLDEDLDVIHFEPEEVDDTETVLIHFSSGSTGLPKGICLSHRAYLGRMIISEDYIPGVDRLIDCFSYYWSTSTLCLGITVLNGCSKIILPTFDAIKVWTAIKNFKSTYLFMTPYNMVKLWNSRNVEADTDFVKTIVIGGDVMFNYQLLRYKEMFPSANVVTFYGLTETGTLLRFQLKPEIDQLTGHVLHGTSYKVIDVDTGETLGPNQEGELLVKTQYPLTEYHTLQPDSIFDPDGWLKTGDCLYYDHNFCFYYLGRLKELIKYQTWQVSPSFIENVLMTLDYVANARVIGIANEDDGEHPMAVVELTDGCLSANIKEEICNLVEEKLGDKYKLRGGIKIVKKIPVTVSGKLSIRKLRAMLTLDN